MSTDQVKQAIDQDQNITAAQKTQLSRNAKAADLPAELRDKLNQGGSSGEKPGGEKQSGTKDSTGGSF